MSSKINFQTLNMDFLHEKLKNQLVFNILIKKLMFKIAF
jgi:hypothetical protein